MEKINLTKIITYPVKSTQGIYLESASVHNLGLPYDRNFAVIGLDNKIITARENPKLLNIISKIDNGILELSAQNQTSIQLILDKIPIEKSISVGIFKKTTSAIPIQHPINNWISNMRGSFLSSLINCTINFPDFNLRGPFTA